MSNSTLWYIRRFLLVSACAYCADLNGHTMGLRPITCPPNDILFLLFFDGFRKKIVRKTESLEKALFLKLQRLKSRLLHIISDGVCVNFM